MPPRHRSSPRTPPPSPRRPPPSRRSRRRQQESEASVPKMKTHKGTQKRVGVTGSGKFIRVKSWRGHHLEIKSSRPTRRYARKAVIGPQHQEQLPPLLPPPQEHRWQGASGASPPPNPPTP